MPDHRSTPMPEPRRGRRAGTQAALAALAVTALAVCALTATDATAGASPAPKAACSSVPNPYSGARVSLVYAKHGIAVRRYTKAGLSPLYVATADTANAIAGPILPSRVTVKATTRQLVAGSRALVGINGDFFRINGDGSSMSVEVVAGRVVKARSIWQPALVTLPSGQLAYGPVRANIALIVRNNRYLANAINDPTMQHDGVSMFTPAWGTRQPVRSVGGWREWIVSRGRVVATHTYATRALIPKYGYVVEASGASATRMQMMGWHTGATVGASVSAISTVGTVRAALGAGSRLVHAGVTDRGGCVYDRANGRTVVGMYAGGRKVALVTVSYGRGLTERETAAFMRSIGVSEAVSLDGGGSTTMATHAAQLTIARYRVNRPVPNGFGFYPR